MASFFFVTCLEINLQKLLITVDLHYLRLPTGMNSKNLKLKT